MKSTLAKVFTGTLLVALVVGSAVVSLVVPSAFHALSSSSWHPARSVEEVRQAALRQTQQTTLTADVARTTQTESTQTFTQQQGEMGILLKANTDSYVSCDLQNIAFPLLGPVLSKDAAIRFKIIQYEGTGPGDPNDKVFYSQAEHQADPALPPNTLTTFERGKKYVVRTDADLQFQCGSSLETVYRCGNGIIEAGQAIEGKWTPAEECDGGPGCSPDCKKVP